MIKIKEDSASHGSDYATALRAIAYALKAAKVEAFELACEAPNYVIRVESQSGKKRRIKDLFETAALKALRRIFPSRYSKSSWTGPELIYTPQHIARLDRDGRLKRREGGQPDPHSLPQALRAIGAYLDHKDARLLQIAKRGPSITIGYETALDGQKTEEFTPPSLYALFVQRYVKRSDRQKRDWSDHSESTLH
jgi:hypothetical protein